VHKELGGDTARMADPNQAKGYPMPRGVMLSIESWGKKKEGGMVGVVAFVFPSMTCDGAPLSWRWP